jgi:hypothetical protein
MLIAAVLILICSQPVWAQRERAALPGSEPELRLEVKPSMGSGADADEVYLHVTLATTGKGRYEFRLGSFAQDFGIYILGPWGPVSPDPARIRAEQWLHQEHSKATLIQVSAARPYTVSVKLSNYFDLANPKQFKPGVYQVNVKFFEGRLGMRAPIDSGTVQFRIQDKRGPAR